MPRKNFWKEWLLNSVALAAGGFLFACGIHMFTEPNNIAMGGATGVALMLHQILPVPMGVLIVLLNLPLFFGSIKLLGREFMIKTVIATVVTSLFIDLTEFLPSFTEDKLLAAIFGGILSGAGLGIIYLRGMATGGSDLLARILLVPFPFISYGQMILLIDTVIVAASAIVFRDFWTVLYSAIVVYLVSTVIDTILGGMDRAKTVQIITAQEEALKQEILTQLHRGVTLLDARGGWSNEEKTLLVVVVRKYELFRLKSIIHQTDPDAFVIVGNANEVLGEGFKDQDPDSL